LQCGLNETKPARLRRVIPAKLVLAKAGSGNPGHMPQGDA
jgi:hypothetical protein